MKIYFAHNNKIDYENEIYKPLENHFKNSGIEFFLPERCKVNTLEEIKKTDLFFAEVSYHSTGMGIEIGRAEAFNRPIFCFYKEGNKISNSIKYVTKNVYSYKNTEELLKIIEKIIEQK